MSRREGTELERVYCGDSEIDNALFLYRQS